MFLLQPYCLQVRQKKAEMQKNVGVCILKFILLIQIVLIKVTSC